MTDLQNTHVRKYGPGSRCCRKCGRHGALIRKYHLMMCRQCFRDKALEIGFKKLH